MQALFPLQLVGWENLSTMDGWLGEDSESEEGRRKGQGFFAGQLCSADTSPTQAFRCSQGPRAPTRFSLLRAVDTGPVRWKALQFRG